MKITQAMLDRSKSKKGGFSLKQIEMGVALVGSPWAKKLLETDVGTGWWAKFAESKCNDFVNQPKAKPVTINAMAQDVGEWYWRPQKDDIPKIKTNQPPKKKTKKKKRKIICRKDNTEFYKSQEWLGLRARVLEKYECKCMMCGRSPKAHGVVIHVDHIKPRSKFPELSLEFTNLQLLCEDCNLGKGNKYSTDWRPASNG